MSTPEASATPSAPHSNHNTNFTSILSLYSKVTLDGTNYNDWMRNIKMALRFEDKEYVLKKELIEIDQETATPEEYASLKKHYDDATKVACIMVATMVPELQRLYEDYWPYEMNKDLMEKFHKRARQEKYEVVKALIACKMKEGESVCGHVQRMQRYVERLVKLNGKGKKRKGPPKQNWKEKSHAGSSSNGSNAKSGYDVPAVSNPKDADCFYCKEKGHYLQSCPKYLQDIKDGKVKPSSTGDGAWKDELDHGKQAIVTYHQDWSLWSYA
ncbi:hypothetical protein L2E82_30357 [Cichorium intybus]|uniref:Uncharacterized protein n=1 Tax=Cichorium intybus TaxID=13427 RepID=A0ACB9D014_CICIN|nr:hypothetical protein L2E82_30357 [Cichorium intybus]